MNNPGRKKVLILTYYWPPSGGAGVQRWLKFTKYMQDFGFEPVIYTAENPEYPSLDDSLSADIPENLTVLRTRVREPYKLYKWFTLQKKGHRVNTGFLNREKKKGLPEKISVGVRGNFFIPDARKFWIRPSIRYLVHYLGDHPVSLVVSTGPPHSLHLIALGVAERLNIPWVADFRDPWTKIDYYRDLKLTAAADRRHHRLERKVLQAADAVTVISHDMKRQFEEICPKDIRVIPNGFDPDDFKAGPEESAAEGSQNETGAPDWVEAGTDVPDGAEAVPAQPGGRLEHGFCLTHIGTIVPSRNPVVLWDVLSDLVAEQGEFAENLSVKLVGAIDYSVQSSIEKAGLQEKLNHIEYLPHQQAVRLMGSSEVLLLLINRTSNAKGILTGKFFEYLCSGRPILAIGPPDGEAARVLRETGTGYIVDFEDPVNLKKLILELYSKHRKGVLQVNAKNIEPYSRRNLTREMTALFHEILHAT